MRFRALLPSLLTCVLILTLAIGLRAQTVTPGGYLKSYVSAIDGSTQNYGLYIPTSYAQVNPHPVIFIGHGFNGGVSSSFDAFQQSFADTNGFFLVQLNGRGNTFYDGVGEVDLFDVLNDLRAKYSIDNLRLYFEGASMGATGAYRLGVRHPDVLAAVAATDGWTNYQCWYPHWYGPTRDPYLIAPFRLPNLQLASCVDIADQAMWQNMLMIVDVNDTTVWPQNSYSMNARLDELDRGTLPSDYAHILLESPGEHCYGYDRTILYDYFLGKVNNPTPPRVRIATTCLKYGKLYWAGIDRMQVADAMTTLDADVAANTVSVATNNVLQYSLALTNMPLDLTQPVTVVTDGHPSYNGSARNITLYASLDTTGTITDWSESNTLPGGLRKTAGLEGPIGDAYTTKFIVVYGNSGTSTLTKANKAEADAFCSNWNSWMHASIVSRAESTLTSTDIATSNLILFGAVESSSLLKSMTTLPVKVSNSGITLGGKSYTGANYGAYFIYPNPKNTSKYLVVSHKTIPGSTPKDLEALPWYWPDYVIFDTNLTAGTSMQSPKINYLPDTFVAAGFFDAYWQLPAPPPPPAMRPDLLVGIAPDALSGDGVYDNGDGQQVTQTRATGVVASYYVQVQNDAASDDTIVIKGPASSNGVTVSYTILTSGENVTTAMTSANGWRTALSAGGQATLKVDVTLDASVLGNSSRTALLTATSAANPDKTDAVKLVITKPALTSAELQLSPPSTAVVNTAITLKGIANGGGALQYRFRMASSPRYRWTTLRNWSTSDSYVWTPSATGTYQLAVDIREGSSSTAPVYTKIITGYTVTNSLKRVSLNIVSDTTLTVGTPVTLIASAEESSPTLQYRFQAKNATSRVWSSLRGWNTNPMYTGWRPAAGSYQVSAAVRDPATGVTVETVLPLTVIPNTVHKNLRI